MWNPIHWRQNCALKGSNFYPHSLPFSFCPLWRAALLSCHVRPGWINLAASFAHFPAYVGLKRTLRPQTPQRGLRYLLSEFAFSVCWDAVCWERRSQPRHSDPTFPLNYPAVCLVHCVTSMWDASGQPAFICQAGQWWAQWQAGFFKGTAASTSPPRASFFPNLFTTLHRHSRTPRPIGCKLTFFGLWLLPTNTIPPSPSAGEKHPLLLSLLSLLLPKKSIQQPSSKARHLLPRIWLNWRSAATDGRKGKGVGHPFIYWPLHLLPQLSPAIAPAYLLRSFEIILREASFISSSSVELINSRHFWLAIPQQSPFSFQSYLEWLARPQPFPPGSWHPLSAEPPPKHHTSPLFSPAFRHGLRFLWLKPVGTFHPGEWSGRQLHYW